MIKIMDKVLTLGLVILAAITLWSVLTPNHLFVG
jgi:sensor domain CHASE-containing protein